MTAKIGLGPDHQSLPNNTHIEVLEETESLLTPIKSFLAIPEKVLFANTRFGSGQVSAKTIDTVTSFLQDEGLDNVAVRVNDYNSGWYISRFFTNPKTNTLVKLLSLSSVFYEILGLNRLFVRDRYDFLTDSIYISSDDSGFALAEAGRASIFEETNYPQLTHFAPGIGFLAGSAFTSVAMGKAASLLTGLAAASLVLLEQNHRSQATACNWAAKKLSPEESVSTQKTVKVFSYYFPLSFLNAAFIIFKAGWTAFSVEHNLPSDSSSDDAFDDAFGFILYSLVHTFGTVGEVVQYTSKYVPMPVVLASTAALFVAIHLYSSYTVKKPETKEK